jgi:hypothetical protein
LTRAKQRLSALREVQSLRVLQSTLAEAELVSAQKLLREAQEQTQAERVSLAQAVDDWNASVSGRAFDPTTAAIWSRHINVQVANVADAEAAENGAQSDVTDMSSALALAQASEDCATTLVKQTSRKRAIAAEILAAADLADERGWRTII